MALDVLADQVEFQVYLVALLHRVHVGMVESIGDNGNGEVRFIQVIASEADAVDRDRALFYNIRSEMAGIAKRIIPAAVICTNRHARAGGIYMSKHNVPVEAAIHLQATFKVYHVTHPPRAKVGFNKGFLDRRYAMLISIDLFHGQASAVMRYALIGLEFAGDRGGKPEHLARSVVGNGFYTGDGLDDTCKHGCKIEGKFDNTYYLCSPEKIKQGKSLC